jgi:hypothetical protein
MFAQRLAGHSVAGIARAPPRAAAGRPHRRLPRSQPATGGRLNRANATYPRRTLKVTLLDASRGKTDTGLFTREGSAYHADNLIPTGPQRRWPDPEK